MAHNRQHHTIADNWGNELKIGTSFWQDEGEPSITSILSIDTGMAHLQISATALDLRGLANFFTMRAEAFEAAQNALALSPTKSTADIGDF